MQIKVLGTAEEWGGALPVDIAAVAGSVAGCFVDAIDERPPPSISLEPSASSTDYPVTLYRPAADGSTRILLPVRGNLWARLVFQFAHELCHALVGIHPGTAADWLEESLCEVASLFALGSTARSWARRAPRRGWEPYALELARYREDRRSSPEHQIPSNISFDSWLRGVQPLIEARAAARRDYNAIIAIRLLGIFDRVPGAWRTVRYLNSWQLDSAGAARDVKLLFANWRAATPVRLRHFIDTCERRLVSRGRQAPLVTAVRWYGSAAPRPSSSGGSSDIED